MSDSEHDSRVRNPVADQLDRSPELYALLGNETRLEILLAIWAEQVPLAPDNAVPFSRIFDRVSLDDRGNVSYHLDKLVGSFITQHKDRGGYELLIPGLKLIRTAVAGTGVGDTRLEPTVLDEPCPLCDERIAIRYRDGVVFVTCTECAGVASGKTDIEGTLSAVYFEPAGVEERTPEELFAASISSIRSNVRSFFDGLCPTCSGPVNRDLVCCSDHQVQGCSNCGRQLGIWARVECRVCKNFGFPDPRWLSLCHPAVTAFYQEHGVATRVPANDPERASQVFGLVHDQDIEVISREPARVAVMAMKENERVRLRLDETVQVVDVQRS